MAESLSGSRLGCVIGGTGTFRLNSPTNSSNAQIVTTTGQVESVTHGPAHTIEGEGGLTRLNMLNQGTLSPGFDGVIDPAIGIFEMSLTSIMCEPTSTVVIEIEGAAATEHDRIVKAIETRDEGEAQAAAEQHISNAFLTRLKLESGA